MKPLRLLILGLLAASSAEAALAELRVLRSTGAAAARYPVGTRLPDDQRFDLRPGERVVVLRSRGGAVTIVGPASGPLPQLIRQGRTNVPQAGNAVR